jgi:hypothetical protein
MMYSNNNLTYSLSPAISHIKRIEKGSFAPVSYLYPVIKFAAKTSLSDSNTVRTVGTGGEQRRREA